MRKLTPYQKFQLIACLILMLSIVVAASRVTNFALGALARHAMEQKAETEQPEATPGDESSVVEWDVLLDSPELTEQSLEEVGWETFEEAGLSYKDIIFEDEPEFTLGEKPWDMNTPLVQQMKTIRYGSKISFNWFVLCLDTVCTMNFTMQKGQYLKMHASYKPTGYEAKMAYVTPDHKVHAFNFGSGGSVSKTIKCPSTGKYRICFLNRSRKTLQVAGFYQKSTK